MPLQTSDIAGRAYLKLNQAKEGMIVELDGGFTCRTKGTAILYSDNSGRLFFCCDAGCHFIYGQADDGIHCVGIYPLQNGATT